MLDKISNYITSFNPFNAKLAPPKQVVKNLTLIAIPMIALAGLAYQTTKVEAGPVAGLLCFISCMSAGTVASGGSMISASVAACNAICAGLTVSPIP